MRRAKPERPNLAPLPFWSSLSVSLARLALRRLSAVHICYSYHHSWLPSRMILAGIVIPSRFRLSSRQIVMRASLSPELSDPVPQYETAPVRVGNYRQHGRLTTVNNQINGQLLQQVDANVSIFFTTTKRTKYAKTCNHNLKRTPL